MRALGADRPAQEDYSVVDNFHNQLTSMLDSVPTYLRPHNPDTSWDSEFRFLPLQREYVLTGVNATLMALHRSHVSTRLESRVAALEAATMALGSQKRMFEASDPSYYKTFTLSFCTVDAGVLLSALAVAYPPEEPALTQQIDTVLGESVAMLAVLQRYSRIARSGLLVLRSCHQRFKDRLKIRHVAEIKGATAVPVAVTAHAQPFGMEQWATLDSGSEGVFPDAWKSTDGTDQMAPSDFETAFPTGLDDTDIWSYTSDLDFSYWNQHVDQITNDISDAPSAELTWDSLLNAGK